MNTKPIILSILLLSCITGITLGGITTASILLASTLWGFVAAFGIFYDKNKAVAGLGVASFMMIMMSVATLLPIEGYGHITSILDNTTGEGIYHIFILTLAGTIVTTLQSGIFLVVIFASLLAMYGIVRIVLLILQTINWMQEDD